MINKLFEELMSHDLKDYSSLLFNLYEDKNAYTIEACFDDDSLIIGRDEPFRIEGDSWQNALEKAGEAIRKHIEANEQSYKHLKEIAYGFVDGDLEYIRKPEKQKEKVRFTAEDFMKLDPLKLKAWLSVHLTPEAKEKSRLERGKTDFKSLSEDQRRYWCEYLAVNFDYEKFGNS